MHFICQCTESCLSDMHFEWAKGERDGGGEVNGEKNKSSLAFPPLRKSLLDYKLVRNNQIEFIKLLQFARNCRCSKLWCITGWEYGGACTVAGVSYVQCIFSPLKTSSALILIFVLRPTTRYANGFIPLIGWLGIKNSRILSTTNYLMQILHITLETGHLSI